MLIFSVFLFCRNQHYFILPHATFARDQGCIARSHGECHLAYMQGCTDEQDVLFGLTTQEQRDADIVARQRELAMTDKTEKAEVDHDEGGIHGDKRV